MQDVYCNPLDSTSCCTEGGLTMWIVLAVVAWAVIGSVEAVIVGSFIHIGAGEDAYDQQDDAKYD